MAALHYAAVARSPVFIRKDFAIRAGTTDELCSNVLGDYNAG
jgi:hypothetical protein